MINNGVIVIASEPEIMMAYGVSDAAVIAKKEQCAALTFDTPANYKLASRELSHVKSIRVDIEKRRKELKADSLEYGRRVDSIAKQLTSMILEIEEPLQAKKDAVDAEKERVREEKEAAERAKLEEQARLANEAREAELRAIREEEERKLAEQRAAIEAEKARLAAEQAKIEATAKAEHERIEAEQRAEREKIRLEREALEAEKRQAAEAKQAEERKLAAERERLAKIESDRIAKEKAEKEAVERAERQRVELEEKRVAELERQSALEARMAALRPDKEKLEKVAEYVTQCLGAAIKNNEVTSDEARKALSAFTVSVAEACKTLREFCK